MTDNKSPSPAVCVELACMTKSESFFVFFFLNKSPDLKPSHTEASFFLKCNHHIGSGSEYETHNSLLSFTGTMGEFLRIDVISLFLHLHHLFSVGIL